MNNNENFNMDSNSFDEDKGMEWLLEAKKSIEKVTDHFNRMHGVLSQISDFETREYAKKLYRLRRDRADIFAPYGGNQLFGEPVWDMLLDLYDAHYSDSKVSVSSLCLASSVPPTTALRWINTMLDKKLISRVEDPDDARRAYLTLTPGGMEAMTSLLCR